MKKIYIVIALLLNIGLFSCTQPELSEGVLETQACCGDDGHIPPPPPPPPPGGNG